jgi:hypothetical protein
MTISVDQLREILKYDPDTGKFTWRERLETFPSSPEDIRRFNTRNAGELVYEEAHRGYGRMSLLGKRYKSHRVAWCMTHGAWPDDQIDHINGVRSDNRIENLRAVSQIENSRNMRRLSNNKSGVTGVNWDKKNWRWVATISVNNKSIHLCQTKDFATAVAARRAAEEKYNFHPNHGRD